MRQEHAACTIRLSNGKYYKISPGKTEGRLNIQGGIHLGLMLEEQEPGWRSQFSD